MDIGEQKMVKDVVFVLTFTQNEAILIDMAAETLDMHPDDYIKAAILEHTEDTLLIHQENTPEGLKKFDKKISSSKER